MSELHQTEPQLDNNDRLDKPQFSQAVEEPQSLTVANTNQDSFSVNSQNVQPFSSLDQNRTETKNEDFDGGLSKHAHVGHIVKISSSQDVLDATLQPNLHKTHSQSGQNNEEEQNVDVTSCEANPDQSKRELSISQSEGFVTSKLNQKEVLETQTTEKSQQVQNVVSQALQEDVVKNEQQSQEIPQQKQTNEQNQQNQDEQQFGDFEETVPNNVQNQLCQQQSEQQNLVKIKQAYLNSQQSAFYKQKQTQLQALVDKLDDYSILLQQAEYQG